MDIQFNIPEQQGKMLINVDINSTENMEYVVKLLESLSFVKSVEAVTQVVEPIPKPIHGRFARFYGSAKTGLSSKDLDRKLIKIRDQWERNI